jgi:F-type H+-transporting ATPase subunit a
MNLLKRLINRLLPVVLSGLFILNPVLASDNPEKEKGSSSEEFTPSEFIIEHIKDSHEWHILTKKNGEHVAVHLPIIVYSKNTGLNFFMSGRLSHGSVYKGFKLSEETGKIIEVNPEDEEIGNPLDFSITKTVAGMMLAALVILLLFLRMGHTYSRKKDIVPSHLNGFLEPMIIFIRDEIAIPNIGHHKYERFMPYLLTAFFFILINNIMGLIPFFPFGANVTGNIAVTFILALLTFIITQFSGTKNYWKHIFATPGVPVLLAPIMIPVELIGLISKPFALMIRLFANITAGHIVVLSLVSLIFIFKALWVSSVSIPMVLFIDVLEILVAFLQAYVFTLLSALFIGLAAKEHHE